MKNRPVHIIEWGWLIASLLGLIASAHSIVTHGTRKSFLLIITTLFCILVYLMRRNIRKKSQSE